MLTILLLLAFGIGLGYAIIKFFPNASKRWFRRVRSAQKLLFTIAYIATTAALLISGVAWLMFLGVVFVGIGVLIYEFEEPQEEFKSWM